MTVENFFIFGAVIVYAVTFYTMLVKKGLKLKKKQMKFYFKLFYFYCWDYFGIFLTMKIFLW